MSYAYVTLVMKGDKYIPGALVLAESLKSVHAKYPLICMVTNDVSSSAREALLKKYDNVVTVPYIHKKSIRMNSAKQAKIYGSWIEQSYTKWNILNKDLFPYDKVLFVDADMIFIQNCDHLFNLQAPALTFSSPWAVPYKNNGIFNPYGEVEHGKTIDSSLIIKGFSSIIGISSLVLISPNTDVMKKFKSIIDENPIYGHRGCINGVDEQSIVETYISIGATFTHIHQQYNWLVGKHNWLINGETPKTYHYYNTKPWEQNRNEWPDLAIWYAHVDHLCLDKSFRIWFP